MNLQEFERIILRFLPSKKYFLCIVRKTAHVSRRCRQICNIPVWNKVKKLELSNLLLVYIFAFFYSPFSNSPTLLHITFSDPWWRGVYSFQYFMDILTKFSEIALCHTGLDCSSFWSLSAWRRGLKHARWPRLKLISWFRQWESSIESPRVACVSQCMLYRTRVYIYWRRISSSQLEKFAQS